MANTCSYHTKNAARVACANCSRPLCAYCDHRIKGYPYCQDCIVAGIENLSARQSGRGSKAKARLAALAALIPGMGAVFNRQNYKAIAHFITIIGLFQLSEIRGLETLFALSGGAFYLYSIIDAYRTAIAIAQGENPAVNEARFRKSIAKRSNAVGLAILTAGILLFIHIVKPFNMDVSLLRFLPVALILLGGYLIVSHVKRSREPEPDFESYTNPPYPLIPMPRETEKVHQFAARGGSSGRLDN